MPLPCAVCLCHVLYVYISICLYIMCYNCAKFMCSMSMCQMSCAKKVSRKHPSSSPLPPLPPPIHRCLQPMALREITDPTLASDAFSDVITFVSSPEGIAAVAMCVCVCVYHAVAAVAMCVCVCVYDAIGGPKTKRNVCVCTMMLLGARREKRNVSVFLFLPKCECVCEM